MMVFLASVLVGAMLVAWRTISRAATARTHAQTEARATGNALELQVNQVVWAVDVLGGLANQNPGVLSNFTKIATGLMAAHPGLTSLELQPGGIVREIVPSHGNERAIGFNIFNDPVRRNGANLAIQQRALTVVAPLRLHGGEPGLAAMVPVYQHSRDGRAFFWGLVAGSLNLSATLRSAHLDELRAKGYRYALLAAVPGQPKPVVLAGDASIRLAEAVHQLIRAPNLELRLAIQPLGGWVKTPRVIADALSVLVVSGVLSLGASLWNRQRLWETASTALNRELEHEAEDRKQAQKEFQFEKEHAQAAETELKRLRAALQESAATFAREKAQLEQAERNAREIAETAETRRKQAESRAGELEVQLDSQIRAHQEAARALQQELQKVRRQWDEERQASAPIAKPEEIPQPKPAQVLLETPAESPDAAWQSPRLESEAKDKRKISKPARPSKPDRNDQMDLFGAQASVPPPPPLRIPELRQAVHDIVPLLGDQDPGANDCLKANRDTFRSAFTSEVFVEFEKSIEGSKFTEALEQLRKAVKRHGLSA
jgi:sensor domain CHASE-containing protein